MQSIHYTVKKKRGTRRMSIIVKHGGAVIVTLPWYLPQRAAEEFVHRKAEWILAAQAKLEKKFKNKIPLKQTKSEYKEKKDQALKFIESRLKYFNSFYEFKYKNIKIKNHTSRWGSCSAQGNLNFNYKLIDIPQDLADYIVVHELCHLKELNHSQKFWDLVAKTVPDYKLRRLKLRKNYVTIQ
jgi:predicted metal-dependent hydrolase